MTLARVLYLLLLAFPRLCPTEPLEPRTNTDFASLADTLQQLIISTQGCVQQNALQERVTKIEVSLASIESTVNRLVIENAQLKEAFSQESKLKDLARRLVALEDREQHQHAAEDGDDNDMTPKATTCTSPFKKVMGRCVHPMPWTSGKWVEMRQVCQRVGADLVVIDSADFLWALIQHLRGMSLDTVDYWVGGFRRSTKSDYRWVDGTIMKTGTPFWGYATDYNRREPYHRPSDLHICIWKKGLYFMYSCGVDHQGSPICQK
ncbi:uncharacterized protein LOC143038415 [Oratosquilla oratoria]|uniref:uncharacterized protein LOC143038415 n=1 Tax=Oratosquilla oratoria TaxID=337810 RepID=UPI003F76A453